MAERAKALARAQKFAVRALCPTQVDDHEALAAYNKFRKLAVEHGFKIDEVCAGIAAAGPNAAAWTLDDFMRAGDKVKDIIAMARDPEVQKTIAAGREVFSGLGALLKKVRK